MLLLVGCAVSPNSETGNRADSGGPSASLVDGFAGMATAEIIDTLEATAVVDRSQTFMASIRPHELVLTDESGGEMPLPMPDEVFYVSVAPYVTETHDCYFHSLTTCLGELRNADVSVTVTNESGEVVLQRETQTADNGFIGLWLPRDMRGTLTVDHDGLRAELPIATGSDDPTCVTTARLV